MSGATQVCTVCHEVKPLEAFRWRRNRKNDQGKGRRRKKCRACQDAPDVFK